MTEVYAALAPVFLLIALGWGVRAGRIVSAEAFGAVNRFGYFILYPAFLFNIITNANFSDPDAGRFVIVVLSGFGLVAVLALAMRLVIRDDGPAFTSVFQGALRWNGFPLLAAAGALYGPAGLELVGIAYGPLVFFINIACVVVMTRWGAAGTTHWRAIADQLIANPLILACGAGLITQGIGWTEFGPAEEALRLLAQAAMPVALVTVGAGLDFKTLRAGGLKVSAASALKLLAAPLLIWGVAHFTDLSPLATAVAIGMGATPTAAASYTLAREMGGDAQLIAAIITATTIISFITMPLAIALALG